MRDRATGNACCRGKRNYNRCRATTAQAKTHELLQRLCVILAFIFNLNLVAVTRAVAQQNLLPPLQVLPQPYGQAEFFFLPLKQELCRFHGHSELNRPFLYPVRSPSGWPLTRIGHPHDPVTHSHHNSVWLSHADVNGFDFWADRTDTKIVCRKIEQFDEAVQEGDAPQLLAWLVADIEWQANGVPLIKEQRRITLRIAAPVDQAWQRPRDILREGFFIIIESTLRPADKTVTFGQTPFGLIGVRMHKTIGVRDGGGRILNSEGQLNEKEIFRKPARWVDYSGPITPEESGGIALFDHPENPGFPHAFHVRDDGWMGICLTLDGPLTLEPGNTLKVRYGLWCHDGVSDTKAVERQWVTFSQWSF